MNAERKLIEAYQEWHRLAESVGRGIDQDDWSRVSVNQRAIRRLQDRVSRLAPAVRAERAQSRARQPGAQDPLRTTLEDLIALTRHHQALLARKKQDVRLKLDQTGRAVGNLRQIRRSYVSPCPALHTSFA